MKSFGISTKGSGCSFTNSPLESVLALREKRSRRRETLIRQYRSSLICFTLNIPGPRKTFPLARRIFTEGRETLSLALGAEQIECLFSEISEEDAGYTAWFVTRDIAEKLKELSIYIEDTHPLGRLFDIDVFDSEGLKRSRRDKSPGRRCFICGDDAAVCARSRAHNQEELLTVVISLGENFFRKKVEILTGSAALRALIGEAAISPKPGLVDRFDNGAHGDMDFFTFIDSTAAIIPFFQDCAAAGFDHQHSDPEELFRFLRRRGLVTEVLMRRASGGANTHRGAIFALGLLSAAFGFLFRVEDRPSLTGLLDFCRCMTATVLDDFSHSVEKGFSHGEEVHIASGLQGARGEAHWGYPSVRDHGIPVFRRRLEAGCSVNDAGLAAFLELLARTDDTNIVYRAGNTDFLDSIRRETASFLALNPSPEEICRWTQDKNEEFIKNGISPGGSADLLAVTLFLHYLLSGASGI